MSRPRFPQFRTVAATLLALSACAGSIGDEAQQPAGTGGAAGRSRGGSGAADKPAARDPGTVEDPAVIVARAPLRRLSRRELGNTLDDLLGRPVPAGIEAAIGIDRIAARSGYPGGGPLTSAADIGKLLDFVELVVDRVGADVTKLMPCTPAAPGNEAPCARRFVERFGLRAFRRPLARDEADALMAVYDEQRRPPIGADFVGGVRALLVAMLMSPRTLYETRATPGQARANGDVVELTSYELGSRLSYALWGTMPDDRLFERAERDELRDVTVLAAEARRLLGDARARASIEEFHLEWLGLQALPGTVKSAPADRYGPTTAASLLDETRRFVGNLFAGRDPATIDALLSSSRSSVDANAAKVYGLPGPTGPGFIDVELDPKQRRGILTHASFLATHAAENESHPVRRGVRVLERVLCTELPPPPNDVVIDEVPPPMPGQTTRERYAAHAKSACASCHRVIDPVGFAFESYDAIGAHRTTDQGKPVDASGTLALSSGDLAFRDAADLMPRLAATAEVSDCLVKQWFRYLLRRHESDGEAPVLARGVIALRDKQRDLREAVLSLTTSAAFTHRAKSPGEVLP